MEESQNDELFVSLVETAVKHFEDAQAHNVQDNLDETFSAVAVGIEHMSIAEAIKRNEGETEAADLLLRKQEEYIEFSESVSMRRASLTPNKNAVPLPVSLSPLKSPNFQENISSPPASPGIAKLSYALEEIRRHVEHSSELSNKTKDADETTGNSFVIEALAFDEQGDRVNALALYIKAVERYLSYLERIEASNVTTVVGEVLDRIEYLQESSGPIQMFGMTDNELKEDAVKIDTTSSNQNSQQSSSTLSDNVDKSEDSTDVLPENPTGVPELLQELKSHPPKESAWLSSIWGAMRGTIKVPHQGTSHPAPYAIPFMGQISYHDTPPSLGSSSLRLYQDLRKLKIRSETPPSPCSPSADDEEGARAKRRSRGSSWARCKACGTFVEREVSTIEEHIQTCVEGGAVAPYDGIRVITWNMERGYRLGNIIAELKTEKPDIVMLQEVDVGCDRSYCNDTGVEIAAALGMHIAFASEKDHVNERIPSLKTDGCEGALQPIKDGDEVEEVGVGDEAEEERCDKQPLVEPTVNISDIIIENKGIANLEQNDNKTEKIIIETIIDDLSSRSVESSVVESGVVLNSPEDEKTNQMMGKMFERSDESVLTNNDLKFNGGVEGIAILCRYPIKSVRTIHLPATHPETVHKAIASTNSSHMNSGIVKSRTALRVETETPIGLVVAFCCHLDAFAGRTARVHQLQPVLEDAKITVWEAIQAGQPRPHIVLGGDFNTHNHGLARLSRKMSGSEGMSGLGRTEAQWWDDVVFANTGLRDPFNKSDDSHNTWITVAGLTVWGGKIDWLLFSEASLVCDSHFISQGGKSSDHPYLRVDLRGAPEI